MNLNLALVLILCAALLAFLIHHYRIPIRHRWRRRQAREMCEQLRGRDAIRPEHVSEFAQLCATRRQRGLFIHTGRTGGMSRAVIDRATGIEIVSGQRLLALLTGAPFEPGSLPPRNYCGRDRSSFRNRTAQ